MSKVLDNITEWFVNWILGFMGNLVGLLKYVMGLTIYHVLNAFQKVLTETFGTDITWFNEHIPIINSMYKIIITLSICLLCMSCAWQIFRSIGGNISGEVEEPWIIIARTLIFGFCIVYSKDICDIVMRFANVFYVGVQNNDKNAVEFQNTFKKWFEASRNLNLEIISTDIAAFMPSKSLDAKYKLVELYSKFCVVFFNELLAYILLIPVMWNYFKLVLESVERYVAMCFMYYSAPLALSMGAARSTKNITTSWARMYGASLLLLILNVMCLKMFASFFGQMYASSEILLFPRIIFLYGFLKVCQHLDEYMAKMGISVANTGGSLLDDMMAAGRMVGDGAKGLAGSVGRGAGLISGLKGGKGANALNGGNSQKVPMTPGGGNVHMNGSGTMNGNGNANLNGNGIMNGNGNANLNGGGTMNGNRNANLNGGGNALKGYSNVGNAAMQISRQGGGSSYPGTQVRSGGSGYCLPMSNTNAGNNLNNTVKNLSGPTNSSTPISGLKTNDGKAVSYSDICVGNNNEKITGISYDENGNIKGVTTANGEFGLNESIHTQNGENIASDGYTSADGIKVDAHEDATVGDLLTAMDMDANADFYNSYNDASGDSNISSPYGDVTFDPNDDLSSNGEPLPDNFANLDEINHEDEYVEDGEDGEQTDEYVEGDESEDIFDDADNG